jgi:hypothetical protein
LAKRLVNVPEVPVSVPKAFVPLQVLLSPKSVEEAELAPHPVQLPTTRVPMLAVLAFRSVVEARPDT